MKNTQVFPGSSNLKILKWSNYIMDGYDSEMIFTIIYIGTRIYAPIHFYPSGKSTEKISLKKTVILDNVKVLKIIKVDDENIENRKKRINIKKNDTILIHTGWSSNRFKDKYLIKIPDYQNSQQSTLYVGINLVGIDSPNIIQHLTKNLICNKIFSSKQLPNNEKIFQLIWIKLY